MTFLKFKTIFEFLLKRKKKKWMKKKKRKKNGTNE